MCSGQPLKAFVSVVNVIYHLCKDLWTVLQSLTEKSADSSLESLISDVFFDKSLAFLHSRSNSLEVLKELGRFKHSTSTFLLKVKIFRSVCGSGTPLARVKSTLLQNKMAAWRDSWFEMVK